MNTILTLGAVVLLSGTVASSEPVKKEFFLSETSGNVILDNNCTGFNVGNNLIVTAGHCFSRTGHKTVSVVTSMGKYTAEVVASNSPETAGYSDWGLLRVNFLEWSTMDEYTLSCNVDFFVGQEISITGFPMAGEETLLISYISDPDYEIPSDEQNAAFTNKSDYVGFYSNIIGGQSGSAVTARDSKEAFGIVSWSYSDSSLSFFTPLPEDLCDIVEALGGNVVGGTGGIESITGVIPDGS